MRKLFFTAAFTFCAASAAAQQPFRVADNVSLIPRTVNAGEAQSTVVAPGLKKDK